MPAGWQREECRAADNGCVEFRPPDGATGKIDQDPGVPTEAPIFDPAHPPTDFVKPRTGGDELGDRIVVIVSSPDPNAAEADIGRGLLYPGAFAGNGVTYFTVDGVRFAQAHLEAITLVLAVLPNDDDVRIACSEQAKPDIVRAGCQVVIDSLHVRT